MEYYNKKINEVYKVLKTNEKGLTSSEALARLDEYGYNKIESKKRFLHLRYLCSSLTTL